MAGVITSPKSRNAKEPPQYLPIREFFRRMAQRKEINPYPSTFSFTPFPFIEKMKEKKRNLRKAIPVADTASLPKCD